MHFKAILLLMVVSALFSPLATALSLSYYDNWYSDGGTDTDTAVWSGYDLFSTATSISTEADCLCWDWCDGGSPDSTVSNWDTCYCKSAATQTQCTQSFSLINTVCSSGNCSVQSLSAAHDVDTGPLNGSGWTCSMDIKEFRDCDNSAGQKTSVDWLNTGGSPYYVVYPKQYDCDGTAAPDYDFEGDYGPGNVDIVVDIACPANKACDEDSSHLNHDDVLITSAYGIIPNPCSTVNGTGSGNQCTANNQCLSGNCGGSRTETTSTCFSDGANGFDVSPVNFNNTCGGSGYNSGNPGYSTTCTTTVGSGYVCDAALDGQMYLNGVNASNFCKRDLYLSCSTSSQCWHNTQTGSAYVSCMGSTSSKICTTGNNGSTCTNNDNLQCDSLRCDTTCQSKLADGSSCDEPSDCTANACTAGVCGQGQGPGTACTLDSQCASGFCVANICSITHNPKITLTDTWDAANSNGVSSNTDGKIFVNGSVYPNTTGLRETADMVCYDFDGNGVYDACYYDTSANACNGSGCNANSCNFTIPNSVTNKFACDIDSPNGCRIGLDGGTQAKICSGANCTVNTSIGSDFRQITAKAYTNCGGPSSAQVNVINNFSESAYIVFHSKYVVAEDNSPSQPNYFIKGQWGYSDTNSTELFYDACTSNKAVDRVAEEFRVTTPNGVIPDACKKVPGQSCTSNSECLYNVCSGNQCVLSGGIKGHLTDETGHPISGKVMKLTTCSGSQVAQSTTDASGKYSFYAPSGSYKLKTTAAWGEVTFIWQGEPSGCHSFGTGFNIISTWLFTHANIHGRALNPQGFPSVNLPFEAATCQNAILDSDTTDSQGNFDLYTDTGYQKINVNLNGNKFPVTTSNGNACLFQYGEVNLGDIEVTANCSLYNNTCDDSDPNLRLYNCSSSAVNGCSCSTQYCTAGCTEGASVCNVVGTGTIKVSVSDVNGTPIPYAEVRSDGANVGKTNGYGKKDINVQHGSHTVKVTCPNDPISQTKNVYINTNQKYVSYQLNCPTPQFGTVDVKIENSDGFPVANVFIFTDEDYQERGITNPFGVARFKLEYGTHNVYLAYLIEDGVPGSFQTVKQLTVDEPSEVLDHTLLLPGQVGYSATDVQPISPNIAPLVIAGALVVLDVASTSLDAWDYCTCVYPGSDTGQLVSGCVQDLAFCQLGSFVGLGSCKQGLQGHSINDKTNSCDEQFGTFAIGIGLTLVPGDEVVKLGVRGWKYFKGAQTVADVGRVVISSGSVTWLDYPVSQLNHVTGDLYNFTNKNYKYIARPFASTIDGRTLMRASVEVIDDPLRLTDEGAFAAETLAKKIGPGGEDVLHGVIGSHPEFTNEYLARIYNGVGDLRTKIGTKITKLSDRTAHGAKIVNEKYLDWQAAVANGAPQTELDNLFAIYTNQASIYKGVLFESEVLSSTQYLDDVVDASRPFSLNGTVGEIDGVLSNGDLLEIKSKVFNINSIISPLTLAEEIKQAKSYLKYREINGLTGNVTFVFKYTAGKSAEILSILESSTGTSGIIVVETFT